MKFPQSLGGNTRKGIWEAGLLLVLPLAFYRGFAEQFSTPKLFLTKCLIITGLAVWALDRLWRRPLRRRRFSLGLPLLAFCMAALVSCLASPAPRFSLMEVEFALCGPAWVLLLVSWERGEPAVRRISIWIALAGLLVAGITLLQRLGFDPVLLGGYQVDWGSMVPRMRLYSTFGNPNFVAGYLIGAMFAALALVAASRALWAKASWLVLSLIMLAAIIETGSRGAWLGLAAGLIASVAMLLRNGSRSREVQTSGGSTYAMVLPLVIGPIVMLTLSLAQRVAAQLYGRIYLWSFSSPIFSRHPIVGSGWGAYQLLYLEFQGRYLAAHPEYLGYWTNNRLVHNDPLQLLLETGLLGFAAFVWVLWKFGHNALTVGQQAVSAWTRSAVAAGLGGVTAILVDSVFNYQFAVPPTYILLFTFLAIPALLHGAEMERGNDGRPLDAPPPAQHPRLTVWKVAGSVVILATTCGLVWHQIRVLRSERHYQKASDLEDHGNLAGAEDDFRRSVALNNLNGRARFGLSRVLLSRGNTGEALQEIVQAEQTYADSHEEVLRALILDKMGRSGEALAAYRRALWLDPTLTSVQENINRLSGAR